MEEQSKTPTTEGIITSNPIKRSARFRLNYKALLAIVLAGFVIAGVWWLFSSGRLVYASPKSSAVVCRSDVVTKYNAVMFFRTRDGSSTPSLDEVGLKKLEADIKTKARYATDPTCQTILFWTAVHNDNYKAANEAYKAVKSLHEKGNFADSNLRSNEPLFTYETYMNSLSGSGVTQAEGSVGG
jgi:hypothetical protein